MRGSHFETGGRIGRMSLQLREMSCEDIPGGLRLSQLAGWNQTALDWERFLAASPRGCFAMETNRLIVGTAATICYENRFAWISMVLVDPDYRGQGIGTMLLERAVEYLDGAGIPAIKLDATPQGKPIYQKLGFVVEYEIERWMLRRENRTSRQVTGAPQIEDVCQFDQRVFGADRASLLRSLADAAPDLTQVEYEQGALTGYAFGRHGSRADHLGPWVATNLASASRLLDGFLARSGRELLFVDVVCSNAWVPQLVKARGFEFSRPLTRMFRGRNEFPGEPGLICAICGPEFG
jgi:GNAT superfamily N-acetyltransferase